MSPAAGPMVKQGRPCRRQKEDLALTLGLFQKKWLVVVCFFFNLIVYVMSHSYFTMREGQPPENVSLL